MSKRRISEMQMFANRAVGDLKFGITGSSSSTNNISLNTGGDEMLRVAKDGFWVRGEKVPQDDKEAETVYNAFKQWVTWANLTRP